MAGRQGRDGRKASIPDTVIRIASGNTLDDPEVGQLAGARGVGIDCALVAGGIHADRLERDGCGLPDAAALEALCFGKASPNWVLPQLIW